MTPNYGITRATGLSPLARKLLDELQRRGPAAMRAAGERLRGEVECNGEDKR